MNHEQILNKTLDDIQKFVNKAFDQDRVTEFSRKLFEYFNKCNFYSWDDDEQINAICDVIMYYHSIPRRYGEGYVCIVQESVRKRFNNELVSRRQNRLLQPYIKNFSQESKKNFNIENVREHLVENHKEAIEKEYFEKYKTEFIW